MVFLFEGEAYDAQPTLRTRPAYYWQKALNAIGITSPRGTLLAMISGPGCSDLPVPALMAIAR